MNAARREESRGLILRNALGTRYGIGAVLRLPFDADKLADILSDS